MACGARRRRRPPPLANPKTAGLNRIRRHQSRIVRERGMNGGQSINGGGGQSINGGGARHEWRFLGRLLLESVATGAFVSLVLGFAVFIVATQARAAPPANVRQGT